MDTFALIEAIQLSNSLTQDQKITLEAQILAGSTSLAPPPHATQVVNQPLAHTITPAIKRPIVPAVVQPHIESYITPGPYGQRVDKVAAPGTPGTIQLPLTKHVLSLPQATVDEKGNWDGHSEGLMGYSIRVAPQTGISVQDALNKEGALILFQQSLAANAPDKNSGNPKNWPVMIDAYNNDAIYHPVDPAAQAAIKAQWDAVYAEMAKPAGAQPAPQPIIAADPGIIEA
jgi:hypothetical protein